MQDNAELRNVANSLDMLKHDMHIMRQDIGRRQAQSQQGCVAKFIR